MPLVRSYTLGLDVIEQGAGSGVTSRFYLYDGHGSTRGLMNFAASVLQRYAYDAYGNQLFFGNLTPAASASTRFLFSGERSDKATGLQYRRARYYDSLTARFTTDDPFSGLTNDPQTLHKYTFVHGDPVNFDDPSGLLIASTLTTSAIGTQSFAASVWVTLAVVRHVEGLRTNLELKRVADLLETKVYPRIDDIVQPPNMRLFVHGTNTGAWTEFSGFQAIGTGDFGSGFYAFDFSPRGYAAAAERAKFAAAERIIEDRGGGIPFVIVVGIDVLAFSKLTKAHFGYPNAPSAQWSPTVNYFRGKRGEGSLSVSTLTQN